VQLLMEAPNRSNFLFYAIPDGKPLHSFPEIALKRVAILQIRSSRFRSLFLRMSLAQSRCTLLRDMP
ncbi:hypothetical protein ACC745_39025, partial [Rhizobium ruizarguesonis]